MDERYLYSMIKNFIYCIYFHKYPTIVYAKFLFKFILNSNKPKMSLNVNSMNKSQRSLVGQMLGYD